MYFHFILALYYCQLSPVLGKRRKRISSAFPLLGHFTEVVSPYRLGALQNLLNVTPAAPQDTMATRSLSCYFQPWVHPNDLKTRNKWLYNISNQKCHAVQWCYNGSHHQRLTIYCILHQSRTGIWMRCKNAKKEVKQAVT